MHQTTDTDSKRPVILYIVIAILLSAALVLGVWWAKNRSNYFAQQSGQVTQPQGEPVMETASQTETESPLPAPGPQAAAPNTTAPDPPSTPVIVPATGPEQGFLPILGIAACMFAGLSYARARRRFKLASRFTL